jgi:hypothetical protein
MCFTFFPAVRGADRGLSDFTIVDGFGLTLTGRGSVFIVSPFDTKGFGFDFCDGCLTFVLLLIDDIVLGLAARIV